MTEALPVYAPEDSVGAKVYSLHVLADYYAASHAQSAKMRHIVIDVPWSVCMSVYW